MISRINKVELAAGSTVAIIGIAVLLEASRYRLGTLTSMGPGMLPMILGSLFTLLGLGIIVEGRRADTTFPQIPIRPIIAVSGGVILFGLAISRFGLLPALIALVACIALAEKEFHWQPVIITVAILSAVAVTALTLLPNAFNLQLLSW